jgi:hypothetical protein
MEGPAVGIWGIAEGQRVLRSSWDDRDTPELFLEPMLGRGNARFCSLPVRLASKLRFRFSMISPPAITTGLMRSARNGSTDCWLARLSCEDMVPGIARGLLVMLPLRRRTWPSRPYPSWPVPAAGPFRGGLSFLSEALAGGTSEIDLFLRLNRGNRDLNAEDTLGLGVRGGFRGSGLAV